MTGFGNRVIPVRVFEEIGSKFETINLRVVGTPPLYNRTIGLWNLELEYQVWNSSSKAATLEWKQLTQFNSVTLVVSRNGTYPSIQAAVDSANVGDVIFVSPGHYVGDIHISKPLSLLAGKNGRATVVFGQLLIESSNVTLDGFLFHTMSSFKPSLIIINSSSVSVLNCEFRGNREFKFVTRSDRHHRTSTIHLQNLVNSRIMNCLFKDCPVGITVENCTECNIIGDSFSSCLTAVQTVSSGSTHITRNYFEQNLIALDVDSLRPVAHFMDDNFFEKNSAMIRVNGRVFSRTDLEVAVNRSITNKRSFVSKRLKISSKTLVYGHSAMQDPQYLSSEPFVYIKGELNMDMTCTFTTSD